MEYIIAMKSGVTFKVAIKDFDKFIQALQTTVSNNVSSQNHYYSNVGFMFCVEDISAVYPVSAQPSAHLMWLTPRQKEEVEQMIESAIIRASA